MRKQGFFSRGPPFELSFLLPDRYSVFQAKISAIVEVANNIGTELISKDIFIFSDFQRSLLELIKQNSTHLDSWSQGYT